MTIDYHKVFLTLANNTNDLFLILSKDFCILDINDSAEQILGWPKKEVLNQNIHLLFNQGIESFIEPEIPLKITTKSTFIANKDQSLKILWKIIPFENDYTCIIGHKTVLQDEHIKNLQFENILKHAPGLFYWKDLNSIYQGCNEEFAKLAGLKSRYEVIGKSDYDLNWNDRAQNYVDIDQMVITSGQANLNQEEKIRVSKDKIMTAVTNKVPLRDNHGQLIGVLGITTDITHQKEVETELNLAKEAAEMANQAKTAFIANMSHDIRTPVTGIVGVSTIMEDQANNVELKQYARDIHECGEQLLNMLNNILDVISVDHANDNDHTYETFDLYQCIQDIIQLEKPTITTKQLLLINNYDENIPKYIVNDKTKIHRILLNLVGNAIKFTPKGMVTIETKLLDISNNIARIYFAVKDTGIGIQPHQRDKVFERFYRATPSYKGIYKGHGVGLHIAQNYAELLKSEIKLISEESKGTTFYFELSSPIGKETDATQDINPILQKMQNDHAINQNLSTPIYPYTFLLIEDNRIALKVLESIMTNAGYKFQSAINGEAALELAKIMSFDLILTDIGLPGMSGQEFTRQFREWERTQNRRSIPIIGLTAHSEKKIRNSCIQAGMNDAFPKPLSKTMLNTIMTQFFSFPKTMSSFPNELNNLQSDLPDFEKKLFDLEQFPLMNLELALKNFSADQTLFASMLKELIEKEIPAEKAEIELAYRIQDWDKVSKLTHKIKGGLVYLGLIKMQYACQYFDCYQKAGDTKLIVQLYQQMMRIFDETSLAIKTWLTSDAAVT